MLNEVRKAAQEYFDGDLGKHFEGEVPVRLIGAIILKGTLIPQAMTLHEAEFGRFSLHLVKRELTNQWEVVDEMDEQDFLEEGGQVEQFSA